MFFIDLCKRHNVHKGYQAPPAVVAS